MRVKLDENFDVRLAPALAAEGFDVDTVVSEGCPAIRTKRFMTLARRLAEH